MTTLKSLPARPSLESLSKQAKKLARHIAGGNAEAIARARTQLPNAELPLSHRDAQLVLAREYGFAGWRELREEVLKRTGKGFEWALSEAHRAINDNDVERLKTLLAEHSGLLAWHDETGRPLLQATTPYAMNVSDPKREAQFCRPDCAAVLIDAGALVTPSVWDTLIRCGAAGMMALLQQKKVLPRTLVVLAALGDQEGVRACLEEPQGGDRDAVNYAFMGACRFKRETVAAMLLDRAIALDPGLGVEIDRWDGRPAFLTDMIEHCPSLHGTTEPWVAFVKRQLFDAMDRDDLTAFTGWLASQAWLLDDQHLALQADLIGRLAGANRETFIRAMLERSPALLRSPSPPPSPALIWAFDEGHAHLAPLLTRIWPLPDDLPHAAGVGDLDRVKSWFDSNGKPALGDLDNHWPAYDERTRRDLHWGDATVRQVLDVAFAWACVNHHFEIAEFLLGHGANINTTWNTHEPASVLHIAAAHGDYALARFLIDRGIDMTIRDYRWGGTAEGWAYNVGKDPEMHEFLAREEEKRGNNKRVDESPPE
ncbi:MAG TPA: ankyrin repeat domain-containing protein [Steroidobacteraceae bacterium]|jgi:hypothetical protein